MDMKKTIAARRNKLEHEQYKTLSNIWKWQNDAMGASQWDVGQVRV